jgi:hypothetical protein
VTTSTHSHCTIACRVSRYYAIINVFLFQEFAQNGRNCNCVFKSFMTHLLASHKRGDWLPSLTLEEVTVVPQGFREAQNCRLALI